MVPLKRFAPICDRDFVVGEHYRLEVVKDRSKISHDHYFACLHEAFLNLPETIAKEFLNETKFRRWALIQAGYYDETRFKLATPEEAVRFAGFCAGLGEYSEVIVAGEIVAVRKAKSQSKKAMGNKDFQASKTAVLDVIAALIGTDPTTLKREAGRAA
ncbi:MAG: hypothetical protein IT537_08635 [Hyphomicrobiales bacterium]|nr:hypothetical protein [Hyphomicrobiales bacterium]